MRKWNQRKKSQQKDLWHERISAYDDIHCVTPRASLVTPSVSEERGVIPSPSFVIPSAARDLLHSS